MLRIRQDTNEVSGFFYPNYGIMADFSLYNNEIQPTILGCKYHNGQLGWCSEAEEYNLAQATYFAWEGPEGYSSCSDVFALIDDEV